MNKTKGCLIANFATVPKQVMVNTGGNKRQVPAKRQNRGSRNSTDDGG
ncbi:single-stranded DNA-binding protein [Klebsiella pneumoniae]|nr:single-stranded DNA-binding protein [Klebsiella pneumoniae]WKI38841.1 single-stranded DNA-binding protein [Klebsiella pneumoniae]